MLPNVVPVNVIWPPTVILVVLATVIALALPVKLVLATVVLVKLVTMYVPTPPVPNANAVMTVLAGTPNPVTVIPTAQTPVTVPAMVIVLPVI